MKLGMVVSTPSRLKLVGIVPVPLFDDIIGIILIDKADQKLFLSFKRLNPVLRRRRLGSTTSYTERVK